MKGILLKFPPYILSIIVVIAVIYLTLFPDPLPDTELPYFEGIDKVVHGVMMFGVVTALALDYIRSKRHAEEVSLAKFGYFFIATCLFGGAIEIAQEQMAIGRGGDMWDFIADCIGVTIGVIVAIVLKPSVTKWLFR